MVHAVIVAGVQLPPPAAPAAQVRGLTAEILRQSQFRPAPESIVTRVEREIGHLLDLLVQAIISGGHASLVGLAVVIVVIAGVVVLVTRFGRRVRGDPELSSPTHLRTVRPAADWAADAELHEQAGQWRAALRCRYRALVAELAARGIVDEVPGRTVAEYQELVGRRLPETATEFTAASELFEAVWYGNRRSGPAQQAQFAALAHEVLAAAAVGRPTVGAGTGTSGTL